MKKNQKYTLFLLTAVFTFTAFSCQSAPGSTKEKPGTVNENIHPQITAYESDFKPAPFASKNLPVMNIISESGSNDFILLPVDKDITAQKRTWGDIRNDPEPWYEKCTVSVTDGNGRNDLMDVEAEVKVRGNWTSNYPKKPLRIKFAQKQSVLGLHEGQKFKNWVLLASYKDWSFLRDQTGYYLGHLISPLYTSDFYPVDLYVNNEYQGVYIVAEKQDVDKNRINVEKLPENYTGNDIGYLLELDNHSHSDENHFYIDFKHSLKDFYGVKVSHFEELYTVKSDVNDQSQVDFISNYMNLLWQLCYEAVYKHTYYEFNADKTKLVSSSAESCYECISSVIDLESLTDTYILQEIICDADIYLTSFYLALDLSENGSGKLIFEAPWDFDSSLGNKNFCADSKGLYAGANGWDVNHNKKGYGNPWLLVFINCSWFREMISQKWNMVHDQKVIDKLTELIDFEAENYESAFVHNYALWQNCGNPATLGELCSASAACKTEKQAAEYLKNWLVKRFEALDELLPESCESENN